MAARAVVVKGLQGEITNKLAKANAANAWWDEEGSNKFRSEKVGPWLLYRIETAPIHAETFKPISILLLLIVQHKRHGSTVLENPDRQNAAVVLASPNFAEHLDDLNFNSELVKVLSSSGITKDFHLLCAIVDDIAPAPGEPFPTPGISVLLGDLDSLLPQLWQPDPPLEKLERDSVAALTFKVGLSTQTLPLMRTTFLNNKTSTLLISRHDLSGGRPRLEERTEKQWQHVHVEVNPSACSVADFGLWAPLSPVTRARQITASFGNIVRGIEVDGQSIPASTELEAAVNSIFEHQRTAETTMGPMGVWALVTPKESQASEWTAEHAPNPSDILKGKAVTQADVDSCVDYLQRQHQAGSRFYQ
ncbi:hypothetical protein E4U54_006275, partial [Claviceps lovelessii]